MSKPPNGVRALLMGMARRVAATNRPGGGEGGEVRDTGWGSGLLLPAAYFSSVFAACVLLQGLTYIPVAAIIQAIPDLNSLIIGQDVDIAGQMFLLLMAAFPFLGFLLVVPWRYSGYWACAVLLLSYAIIAGSVFWMPPGRTLHITTGHGLFLRGGAPFAVLFGALVGYAIRPSACAFLLGGWLGGLALQWATALNPADVREFMEGHTSRLDLLVGPVAGAVLAGALWYHPARRLGILRLFGLDGAPSSRGQAVTRLLLAALIGILIAVGILLSHLERLTIVSVVRPIPSIRNGSQVNGWPALAQEFEGPHDSTGLPANSTLTPPYSVPPSGDHLAGIRNWATPLERSRLQSEGIFFAPLIAALKAAGNGDYVAPYTEGRRVRTRTFLLFATGSWLGLRARLRAADGDWQGSLDDIRCLHAAGSLEPEGPSHFVMSIRVLLIAANDAAVVYWQAFRDEPDAVAAMAQHLATMHPRVRREVPREVMAIYEPALRPVAFLSEAFQLNSAPANWRGAGSRGFEQLRIVFAAERYRQEHGRYPPTIEALVPSYLDRVPLDRFTQEPYQWNPTADGLDFGDPPAPPIGDKLLRFRFPEDAPTD